MKANNLKINMTNIYKTGFTVALLTILFGFVSCKNPFSEKLTQKAENKTYLMISDGDVSVNSRTINPSTEYVMDNLSKVYLYVKQTKDVNGNAVTVSERTLIGSNSTKLTDVYRKQMLLEDGAGEYTIRMTAELDGIAFYFEIEEFLIEENKTNSITIALEPAKSSDELETPFGDYGGFSFTINANVGYANQDIDSIYVTLKNIKTGQIVEQRYINRKTTAPKLSNKTVYEHLAQNSEDLSNGRIPVGTYRLTLDFLALDQSIQKDIVVNTYSYIMNVVKGRNTYFEETFELNKVYSIQYEYNGASPAPGEKMRTKFISKNEVYLPRMQKEGYSFNGWYKNSSCTVGPVDLVEAGTEANQKFYAKFTPAKLYVDANGNDGNDGESEETAVKTLSRAVELINEANDSSCEWYIYMSGEFTDPQVIAGEYDTENQVREPIVAESINIVGDGNTVLYSTATSAALTILTETPVTLKDIEIDGNSVGVYGIYMGYEEAYNDRLASKVTLGSGVKIHGNTGLDGEGHEGHDVYVTAGSEKSSTVYLYGSVEIDDLYSEAEYGIVLLEDLTSTASVTITPEYYSEPSVYEGEINKTTAVVYDKDFINFASNKDYFHVTPEETSEGTVQWFVDAEGCFNKQVHFTFAGDGTSSMSPIEVDMLTPIWKNDPDFQVPARTGYKFMGWYYVYEETWYDGQNYNHIKFVMNPFDFKDNADDTDFTYIKNDMTLYAAWRYLGSSNIYVDAEDGGDGVYVDINDETSICEGDGSAERPLRTVTGALELIKLINDPSKDYTITISKKTGDYNLAIDRTLPMKSLVLQGKTSATTDGINCHGYDLEGFRSVLLVSTNVPVKIQNMLVQGRLGTYDVDGAIMNVGKGATVTLDDGAEFTSVYSSITSKGAVAVENGGTLIMKDGVTFHDFDIRGGAVYVKTGGTFTMNGGTFENNSSNGTCGAVYVNGGTFTMNDGYIKDNWQDAFQRAYLLPQGAGVCVASGTFIMEGGHITNNGSYVSNVNENYTTAGGGVFVYADGTFIMRGGEITNNHAYNKAKYPNGTVSDDSTASSYGGGICLQASGDKVASFTMTGGTISGNTAGTAGNGIYYMGTPNAGVKGKITLGGTAVIDDDNDIYLPSYVTIEIASELTNMTSTSQAVITPAAYTIGTPVLGLAQNAASSLSGTEYPKFTVTKENAGQANEADWFIDTDGTIYKMGLISKTKPDAFGDIILADGSVYGNILHAASPEVEQIIGDNVVAVIFYAGSATDYLGARVVGLGVHNSSETNSSGYAWAKYNSTGYKTYFSEIVHDTAYTGTPHDLDGRDNWNAICTIDPTGSSDAATNYPAFSWANTYATTFSIPNTIFSDSWYMPSGGEMEVIFDYYKSYNGDSNTLKRIFNALGLSSFFAQYATYWSSSQGLPPINDTTSTKYAVSLYGSNTSTNDKLYSNTVLACYDFTNYTNP